jgi:2-succinyl-5-enolpyruvyl-6-hydroxy-3-cyclohexene-1-carboxylate synthase
MVLNHPLRNDPLHNVTIRIQSNITTFCKQVTPRIKHKASNSWISHFKKANQKVVSILERQLDKTNVLSEAAIAREISKFIPQNTALFLSNSLPIREMDMYANNNGQAVRVEGNRGASGIDGLIASAAGFSLGLQQRVTLFIGDLAFLHDLNSLVILKNLQKPMTIVLLNNDGGGIFSFLPIASQTIQTNNFEKYFGTPHGLKFMEAAKLFGLNYSAPQSLDAFIQTYQDSFKSNQSTLIEIITRRNDNTQFAAKVKKLLLHSI